MQIVYKNIHIVGSDNFIKKTKLAIDLIANTNKELNYLVIVNKYIGAISESEKSGMDVNSIPPTFNVGAKTYNMDVYWYASCIVHDAHHSELFFNNKPYTGKEAELECLELQIKFLVDSNGPKSYINYIKNLINDNVDYYSNYSNRNW